MQAAKRDSMRHLPAVDRFKRGDMQAAKRD